MKTLTIFPKSVKLILDNNIRTDLEAVAAISLNPNVTWMKLILLDDGFNANKQRIPREEFANVIKTGLFMPIKMAPERIEAGHEDSIPLGVIAHLRETDNSIEAMAALWDKERPADIEYLRSKFAKGESIDFSWEVTYTDSEVSDDGESLREVSMNAATIVGMPAYQGRTPAVSVASKSNGDINMDTISLEEHNKKLQELESSNKEALSKLQDELESAKKELVELQPKYDELAQFKAGIEAEKAKAEKIEEIKNKFSEAKLTVDDEYLNSRLDNLLAMSSEQLDFFIQELLAVAKLNSKNTESGEASTSLSLTGDEVPPISGENQNDDINLSDIVTLLRNKSQKE